MLRVGGTRSGRGVAAADTLGHPAAAAGIPERLAAAEGTLGHLAAAEGTPEHPAVAPLGTVSADRRAAALGSTSAVDTSSSRSSRQTCAGARRQSSPPRREAGMGDKDRHHSRRLPRILVSRSVSVR